MEQMKYQTYKPDKNLDAIVKCYWVLESPKEAIRQKQRIVPDGCMEMIFHYGDPYKQYLENGGHIIQPRCFVFGQITRPLEIEPTGTTGIFAVRFYPQGFIPFTTADQKNMENKAVPLDVLLGSDGIGIAANILSAKTTEERITCIESFLVNRLNHPDQIDRMVKTIVDTIVTGNGQLSVEELSEEININRRQLERKLFRAIGLSPKQFSRIIRLQATLKLLLSKQFTSFTDLAYEGAYYDQAHFIRDFRAFTGLTPKEFYGDHHKMSALFYGTP